MTKFRNLGELDDWLFFLHVTHVITYENFSSVMSFYTTF